jgi:outer membrane lipoprotein SlyB
VLWSQVPAYLIGDLAGGVLGGLAWAGIGRVRADASFTSLAPAEPVPAAVDGERIQEGTS